MKRKKENFKKEKPETQSNKKEKITESTQETKEKVTSFVVSKNLLFVDWYLLTNPDVKKANVDPVEHYVNFGAFENRNPNPFFDCTYYYEKNLKGKEKNTLPLIIHYLTDGWKKNYDFHPLINEKKTKGSQEKPGLEVLLEEDIKNKENTLPQKERLEKINAEIQESQTKIDAFLVFGDDAISGGIFSIFSFLDEFEKKGVKCQLYSMPHQSPVTKYARFKNNRTILPFQSFLEHVNSSKINRVHIPEVLFEKFHKEFKSKSHERVALNILNQNEEYMPSPVLIDEAKKTFPFISMTTAHLKYSTQEKSDNYNIPIKHLSTYMSYDSYKINSFKEKENRIVLSPDRIAEDNKLLSFINNGFLGYNLYRVENLHFDVYKHLIQNSKYTITLGEGLDNYFIETFFTGGVAFTIYNDIFMPEELKEFPNVFVDIYEMKHKLSSLISKIEFDTTFREELISKNYDFLSRIYDGAIYRRKITEFLNGHYDFEPKKRAL